MTDGARFKYAISDCVYTQMYENTKGVKVYQIIHFRSLVIIVPTCDSVGQSVSSLGRENLQI